MTLTGEPVRLVEGIARTPGGSAAFSAAMGAATIAYRTADSQPTTRLTWFDRAGRAVGWAGQPGAYEDPSLSPDGSRVAVQRWDTAERRSIWIVDADRGTESRLTTNLDDSAPLWSPDGSGIVYSSARETPPNLYLRSLSGGGAAEDRLFTSRLYHTPTGWSADGRLVLHNTVEAKTGIDMMVFDRETKTVAPLLQTPANESGASISRDGRWILYTSNETGRAEVYVRPLRGGGQPVRISTSGGRFPAWRRDGREIFYIEGRRKLMSVPASAESMAAGRPVLLFEAAFGPAERRPYDVSADGQRVLVAQVVEEAAPSPITVILNWPHLRSP
jgi:Tol biopolymer transport system component